MKQQLNISALRSGGVITNYYCTSSCKHCLYRCSPKWPKEYITPTAAEQNFAAIRKRGCPSVHIGGGEPFLQPEGLAETLAAANRSGIHVEYVETNSSWFRDLDSACRILENLAGLGLTTLLVSISPFHNEFIPFAKVQGVLAACRETGISVLPWTADFIRDIESFAVNQKHPLSEYNERFGPGYLDSLPNRYWIAPGGRALETFGRTGSRWQVSSLLHSHGPCRELAETSHFHLDLYGNYIPGLCAGLSIKLEDLGKPLLAEDYPIITRLHSDGIEALFQYACKAYDFQPTKSHYWSKCELCYDIRRYLVVDEKLTSKELQPTGHYQSG